ncbi:MAG TPA: efflux RND transporter periplasmic adaptor subunit [Dongiaceae bacterium]|nr:efflux RND transporter periplasmic adaptor subunit [Dongiaceae bacterium]
MVLVTPASPQSLQVPVLSRGLVLPGNDIPVVAEVSGPVTYVSPNFVTGGFFKKGEVLMRVDDIENEVKIRKTQAAVAQAGQALQQAQAEAESRRTGGNEGELLQNYDKQAKSQYAAAQAELASLMLAQKNTVLVAPFDGRVRAENLQVGMYLKPGVPLGQIFAVNIAEVRMPLSNQQAALVDLPTRRSVLAPDGPKVHFYTQVGDVRYHWNGVVLGAEGSMDEFNRLLNVYARIEDPFSADPAQPGRPPLTLGTFVEAEIEGRTFDHVFVVPRRAFRNGSQLWTVSADNRLQRKEVEVLYKGRDFIYVKSGLNEGDQIVLSHLDTAADGLVVRPQAAPADAPNADQPVAQADDTQP